MTYSPYEPPEDEPTSNGHDSSEDSQYEETFSNDIPDDKYEEGNGVEYLED